MCLKNLTISGIETSNNCTLSLPFETYKTRCGCSILTLPIYSTLYDLPISSDDDPASSDIITSDIENSDLTVEINPTVFPIFQPSAGVENSQQSNVTFISSALDSENNEEKQFKSPLNDRLKVFLIFKV